MFNLFILQVHGWGNSSSKQTFLGGMDPSGLLGSIKAEMEVLPNVGNIVDFAAAQLELQAQSKILKELEEV